jgi:Cu/Ag efflux protein CusF
MTQTLVHITLVATVALTAAALGCSQTAAERRAASPTLAERVKQDTVTGKVHEVGAKYVSIRESDGETQRVRVDDHTKMDRVAVGDHVKAYVSEDGYATTIQRESD